ncbi:MAG TPA: serine hydrolase, partial [Myxococcaceae bacterium]|nr:serine hydrolase [Myxococcaceae bacterium]
LVVLQACARQPVVVQPLPATTVRTLTTAAYWPTDGWRESPPEAQGLSSTELAKALEVTQQRAMPIHSLLLIRHGVVVLDVSFYPFPAGSRHDLASVTKSVDSALVGVALQMGAIADTTQPAFAFLPYRPSKTDKRRDAIRIEDLLGMQSGLDCGFKSGEPELRQMMRSANWVQTAVDLPMRSAPGGEFGYCSENYHLLSAVLTSATGLSMEAFAKKYLFGPLGIQDVYWPADPQGVTHGWGDLQLKPRDLAKIGYLFLHGGQWEDKQLLSRAWVERSTAPRIAFDKWNVYGYGWWTHPELPPGFYEAIGRGGVRLSIWPEKDVILVLTGGGFEPGELVPFLRASLKEDHALPPDPLAHAHLLELANAVAVASPKTPSPLPPQAASVSGREYQMKSNSMGLRSIALSFPGGNEARAKIVLEDRELDLPVGLDGTYRLAPISIDGISPGARGEWKAGNTFALDVNLIGKINRYLLTMNFDRDAVHVEIVEATGLLRGETSGTAAR